MFLFNPKVLNTSAHKMPFPLEPLQIVNIASYALFIIIHVIGLVLPIGEWNYV